MCIAQAGCSFGWGWAQGACRLGQPAARWLRPFVQSVASPVHGLATPLSQRLPNVLACCQACGAGLLLLRSVLCCAILLLRMDIRCRVFRLKGLTHGYSWHERSQGRTRRQHQGQGLRCSRGTARQAWQGQHLRPHQVSRHPHWPRARGELPAVRQVRER